MDDNLPYDPSDVPSDVGTSADGNGSGIDDDAVAGESSGGTDDGTMQPAEYDDPTASPSPCAYTEYEYTDAPSTDDLPATGADAEGIERAVWDVLYEIEDPEMPVSIVDLGLFYGVSVTDGHATLDMTLTYSGCPAREMLTSDVEDAVAGVDGVEDVTLRLVWSPPWGLEMVTEQGKSDLNDFGLSV